MTDPTNPVLSQPLHALKNTKAIFFDVFGTCVDWRTSITRALTQAAEVALSNTSSSTPTSEPSTQPTTITTIDATTRTRVTETSWPTFADAWRDAYFAFTDSIFKDPSLPLLSMDTFFHTSLLSLLSDRGLSSLYNQAQTKDLAHAWHALEPWPDAASGVCALNDLTVNGDLNETKTKLKTATLSNGNVELLQDLKQHSGIEWTDVLSADMFGTFKPSPKVYLGAAQRLGCRLDLVEGEAAMCTAHLRDLIAARECGFRTIYVERRSEEKWSRERVEQAKQEGWVDMWIAEGEGEGGFLELARRLKSLS